MPSKFTKKLEAQIQDCLLHCDTGTARVLAEDLRRLLREEEKISSLSGEDNAKYQNYLARLQLQALPLFSEDEIAEFFRKSFLKMISDPDINVYDRFKSKQIVMPYELAEDFLLQIIDAIHQNRETIGDERLLISGAPEAVEPTIENWLSDYDRTYGTEPQNDLTFLNYVKNGSNTQRLSDADKELLRKVLKFYEFLKPEYIEET